MTRDTRQAYRRRAADTERMVDQAVAEVKAERDATWEARKAAKAIERERIMSLPPIDPARMVPGAIVGDRFGRVGEVVRVNRTTVTVRSHVHESRLHLGDVIAIKELDA